MKLKTLLVKYWKYILTVVVVLLIVFGGLSTYNGIRSHFKDYNALKAANESLDIREQYSRQVISGQRVTIKAKTKTIDSLDVALSLKRERVTKIKSDVQLLKGDTTAIVVALDRVFSKADNSNL